MLLEANINVLRVGTFVLDSPAPHRLNFRRKKRIDFSHFNALLDGFLRRFCIAILRHD